MTLHAVSLPAAVSWCIALYYRLKGKARGSHAAHLLSVALILGPVEVALVILSGREHAHYYMALLPVITIFLAFLIRFIIEQRLVTPIFLTGVLMFGLVYYYQPEQFYGLVKKYTDIDAWTTTKYHPVADLIQRETEPDDFILVWGAETQIYSMSKRDAPTRFFYQYPLVQAGFGNPVNRGEFISDVLGNRPVIIVDTYNNRLPPLDRVKRSEWQVTDKRYRHATEAFGRFFSFLDREYAVIDEVSGFTIYRLKGAR